MRLQAARVALESKRALRFGAVGFGGFLVDASILALMVYQLQANPFVGRMVSVPIAILFTFLCNRHWSFADLHRPTFGKSLVTYIATQSVGLLCNLVAYTFLILEIKDPLVSLIIASITAMTANYLGARFWAFKR